MTLLVDYAKYGHEHTKAVEYALGNLREYRGDLQIIRSNPELLWEEVVGSVKRYYRLNHLKVVDVP